MQNFKQESIPKPRLVLHARTRVIQVSLLQTSDEHAFHRERSQQCCESGRAVMCDTTDHHAVDGTHAVSPQKRHQRTLGRGQLLAGEVQDVAETAGLDVRRAADDGGAGDEAEDGRPRHPLDSPERTAGPRLVERIGPGLLAHMRAGGDQSERALSASGSGPVSGVPSARRRWILG